MSNKNHGLQILLTCTRPDEWREEKYVLANVIRSGNVERLNSSIFIESSTCHDFFSVYHETNIFSDVNAICPPWDEWTALHFAVYLGRTEMVKILLEKHNAYVNRHSMIFGASPLLIAIGSGHHELIELLLRHGADINDTSGHVNGMVITPMMLAVMKKDATACRLLLDFPSAQKLHVNFFHHSMKHSYLSEACAQNQVEIIDMLIAAGADVNFMKGTEFSSMPLHICFECNNAVTFKRLLHAGAKCSYDLNTTLLHAAIVQNKPQLLQIILEKHPISVNKSCYVNRPFFLPVNIAVHENKMDCLRVILSCGGKVDPPSQYDFGPLHTAVLFGRKEMVNFLIKEGASVHSVVMTASFPEYNHNLIGWQSPLSIACGTNKLDIVRELIFAGNVHPTKGNANLCLMQYGFLSSLNKNLDILESLIFRGLPIDASCLCHIEDRSLVNLVICRDFWETATLLVVHGAIPDWLCHEASHMCLIENFPLNFVESLLVSGACLRNKRASERIVADELWKQHRKETSAPMTLEKLCVRSLRTGLRNNRKCHQRTVWLDIEDLSFPNHIKDLLKMKSALA